MANFAAFSVVIRTDVHGRGSMGRSQQRLVGKTAGECRLIDSRSIAVREVDLDACDG